MRPPSPSTLPPWMPWNYTATLARLAAEVTDPAPD
jgi:hypothetical protein